MDRTSNPSPSPDPSPWALDEPCAPRRPQRSRPRRGVIGCAFVAVVLGLGGLGWLHETPPAVSAPLPTRPAPEPRAERTLVGKNVFLEVQGDRRRVVVVSSVCLREGTLEGLLTRKDTKEHEYILTADADARMIHAALLAAGAEPGSPSEWKPAYRPASGSRLQLTLRYQKDGKTVTARAQDWVCEEKTAKPLDQDWVFAGSVFVAGPDDAARPYYLANQGDLVCTCNMPAAMLDLPVPRPTPWEERLYAPCTERIPPVGTPVEVVFEVVRPKK
jgi:hypothetical protein